MNDILNTIPQREPFLFLDKIVEVDSTRVHAQKKLTGKEDFFKGHFPGNPVMPGVLMCEACFQAGAYLMGKLETSEGLGVVTRIKDTKFRSMAKPGDLLDIKVELEDRVGNACYMKGVISVDNKKVMQISFQVAAV